MTRTRRLSGSSTGAPKRGAPGRAVSRVVADARGHRAVEAVEGGHDDLRLPRHGAASAGAGPHPADALPQRHQAAAHRRARAPGEGDPRVARWSTCIPRELTLTAGPPQPHGGIFAALARTLPSRLKAPVVPAAGVPSTLRSADAEMQGELALPRRYGAGLFGLE